MLELTYNWKTTKVSSLPLPLHSTAFVLCGHGEDMCVREVSLEKWDIFEGDVRYWCEPIEPDMALIWHIYSSTDLFRSQACAEEEYRDQLELMIADLAEERRDLRSAIKRVDSQILRLRQKIKSINTY